MKAEALVYALRRVAGSQGLPGLRRLGRSPRLRRLLWLLGSAARPEQERRILWLNEDLSLVRGAEGDLLTLNRDVGISQSLRESGVWAARDVALFKRLVRPGMCVADIGANLGHHTLVFSRLVGPSGVVVACEPQRIMFQLLSANLALNRCRNTVARQCAVGAERRTVKLWPLDYEIPNNFGALPVSQYQGNLVLDHAGEEVELLTLDELLHSHLERSGRLDFVKIDVQAYELYCLQGAQAVLARYRPMLFLEISPFWMQRMGYDYHEIYRLLAAQGYLVYEPHASLDQPAGVREWSGDEQEEWDILALPSELRGDAEPE